MKVIVGGRCTGKTTRLIQDVLKSNGILVVRDERTKYYILNSYPELTRKIFTYRSLKEHLIHNVNPIYIDDIDDFLAYLINYRQPIVGITINSTNAVSLAPNINLTKKGLFSRLFSKVTWLLSAIKQRLNIKY